MRFSLPPYEEQELKAFPCPTLAYRVKPDTLTGVAADGEGVPGRPPPQYCISWSAREAP